MSKPQRICAQGPCQGVALAGSRFCRHHAKSRSKSRSERAVSARLERWLPGNRSLEGVIELPTLETASDIVLAADSLTRALLKRRIDHTRAGMLAYGLQIAYTARRAAQASDPALRLAAQALADLNLELAAARSDQRARSRFTPMR